MLCGRRVVAEQDQLDALQAHDAIGLGPAAVVADQHADDRIERPPDRKAEVADLEVALLEVLEGDALAVVGVARQVHLAVLADDLAVRPDQDRGVVAVRRAGLARELGVAEVEADAEVSGEIEQRRGRGVRHLALEPGVDLREVVVPVAREEGGERQLREDHQPGAHAVRLAQHARTGAGPRSRGRPRGGSARAGPPRP